MSIGVATLARSKGDADPAHLVKRADEALYQATAGGRDLVLSWQPAKPRLVKAGTR